MTPLWLTLMYVTVLQVGVAPTCKTASREVEDAVEAKARELNGVEYCEFRRYAKADIDGDHVDDLVMLFGIELRGSANNSFHYLAVFPSRDHWRVQIVKVGQRGQRLPQDVGVANGIIKVTALEYAATDAMCCPSVTKELRFQMKHGRLKDFQGED
jgi:hypothetical protein